MHKNIIDALSEFQRSWFTWETLPAWWMHSGFVVWQLWKKSASLLFCRGTAWFKSNWCTYSAGMIPAIICLISVERKINTQQTRNASATQCVPGIGLLDTRRCQAKFGSILENKREQIEIKTKQKETQREGAKQIGWSWAKNENENHKWPWYTKRLAASLHDTKAAQCRNTL